MISDKEIEEAAKDGFRVLNYLKKSIDPSRYVEFENYEQGFTAGAKWMQEKNAKEIEQLKQRLEIAVEHLKFTTHAAEYLYKPDVKLNKNMNPTFYFTLTYEGDLELIEKCKSAVEFLAKISAEKEQ